MSDQILSADLGGIAAYGAGATAAATHLADAAKHAADGGPEHLGSIFGLIGADFLAAYSTTHAAHVATINQLWATMNSISAAADAAARTYSRTDHAIGEEVDNASRDGEAHR